MNRPLAPQTHTSICLMGVALDSGDLGVVALSVATIALVRECCPDARIRLLIEHPSAESQIARVGDEDVSVDVVNARLNFRKPLRENLLLIPLIALCRRLCGKMNRESEKPSRSRWIEELRQATWVGELQGGNGFTDEGGFWNFFAGCLPTLSAIAAGRPPYMLPQSYAPSQRAPGRALARFVASRTRGILARDLPSVQVAIAMAGRFPAPPVEFCPDVTFALPTGTVPSDALDSALSGKNGGPLIGLNVNGGLYNDGFAKKPLFQGSLDYTGFVLEAARALLEGDPTARLLLIPHTAVPAGHIENDFEACEHLIAALPEALRKRAHTLRGVTDPCQIKSAIGRCDFFIASRLHAAIAALSQGVPCVGIADTWQFEGIFTTVEMRECLIDARYDEGASALRLILQKLRERNALREKLRPLAEETQKRVRGTFAALLAPSRRPF